MKCALLTLALILGPSLACAEDCRQYPPGPSRFQCASTKNPQLIEKRQRCVQEANSFPAGTGKKDYVTACMKRS